MKVNGTEINPPAYGNFYLKDNTTPSVITTIGQRVRIAGNSQAGILEGFSHSTVDNVLQYTGSTSGVFYCSCSISMSVVGNNRQLGTYLAINTGGTLNPDTDRITESEVYTIASQGRNEAMAIFFLRNLNPNDRIYPIVQNDTSTDNIIVEFYNLIISNVSNL